MKSPFQEPQQKMRGRVRLVVGRPIREDGESGWGRGELKTPMAAARGPKRLLGNEG